MTICLVLAGKQMQKQTSQKKNYQNRMKTQRITVFCRLIFYQKIALRRGHLIFTNTKHGKISFEIILWTCSTCFFNNISSITYFFSISAAA